MGLFLLFETLHEYIGTRFKLIILKNSLGFWGGEHPEHGLLREEYPEHITVFYELKVNLNRHFFLGKLPQKSESHHTTLGP